VLAHDAQLREVGADRLQVTLDEHRLAVEDVDLRIDHLAMHQQRQPDRLHPVQDRADLGQVAHAAMRVGGGARRVQLHRGQHALLLAAGKVVGVGALGQIGGHQRGEACAVGQRRQDAVAISPGVGSGHHRRRQVRHDDGAGEMRRGVRQHRAQHGTVAQMQMPIIGAAESQAVGHGGCPAAAAGSWPRGRNTASLLAGWLPRP
jgi:hypothetical protein